MEEEIIKIVPAMMAVIIGPNGTLCILLVVIAFLVYLLRQCNAARVSMERSVIADITAHSAFVTSLIEIIRKL